VYRSHIDDYKAYEFFISSILISYSSVFNPIAKGEHRMAQRNVKVGAIKDVSGEVNIAGGDIYRGFTAEQVSVLHAQITSTFPTEPFAWRRLCKGPDAFEEEDAGLFFGREKLIEYLPSGSTCYSTHTGLRCLQAWARGCLPNSESSATSSAAGLRRRWIVFQHSTLLWRR
jgi:hypothetical protein